MQEIGNPVDPAKDFSQHSLRAALGGRFNSECLP
jgi:hypothetical protein